jgi:chaperonin GroEL (HSP60 family)
MSLLSLLCGWPVTRRLKFLDQFKRPVSLDRPTLINVAYTSLATKIHSALAKKLAADVVDAVLTIRPPPPSEGMAHRAQIGRVVLMSNDGRCEGRVAGTH